MRSCVVMPVYNERSTVCSVLDAVRAYFSGPVIVVDDGSTDGTDECLADRDDILLLRREQNRGYGASLLDGFAEARRLGLDVVVTMDCDGQHEPAHIPQFLERIAADGVDVVSGSRYLPDSASVGSAPADRADVNRRVTEEIDSATGWQLTDAFCGFKAYRLEALSRLDLRESGYAMPVEFWAKAHATGLAVEELPVERIYFDHDRSFGQDLDDPVKRFDYYMRVWARALSEGA